jgi:nucleoside-diphosphate-sugar epimerase
MEEISMRVFVTGATGYIGSAVVRELLEANHTVVGLARTEQGAALLRALGAEARDGSLDDLDSLHSAAAAADGVIHLAFRHIADRRNTDFAGADFANALQTDLSAVEAMGAALEGSGKPFVTTAHLNGEASDNAVLALATRGVRAAVASLAPSVHGEGDTHGFVPRLIAVARAKGVSAYIGDGSNRWPAVHRLDAARLYRLALEVAPAGSRLDGVGDEGVPFRDIASVIGNHLSLPLVSIAREEASAHFGPVAAIAAFDRPRSSVQTQELLGWRPTHVGLLADLEQGFYFNQ